MPDAPPMSPMGRAVIGRVRVSVPAVRADLDGGPDVTLPADTTDTVGKTAKMAGINARGVEKGGFMAL